MDYFTVILLIGFLIFTHEFGHFIAAKLLKIPIECFSIGFGPKLWSFKRKETEYVISIVPFGGYVMPKISSEDEFYQFPWKSRILFTLGGPIANIILAIIGFSVLNLTSESSINTIFIKPFLQTFNYLYQFICAIPEIFKHHDQLSGILGIVIQGGQFTKMNFIKLVNFSILLNINLVVLNMLPLPPLDGGNILFYLFERIHPKLLKIRVPLAITGWMLLISLMIYATVLDIGRYMVGVTV